MCHKPTHYNTHDTLKHNSPQKPVYIKNTPWYPLKTNLRYPTVLKYTLNSCNSVCGSFCFQYRHLLSSNNHENLQYNIFIPICHKRSLIQNSFEWHHSNSGSIPLKSTQLTTSLHQFVEHCGITTGHKHPYNFEHSKYQSSKTVMVQYSQNARILGSHLTLA